MLQGQGVQQLELDLRDNLGGLFMEGVEVARLFLPGAALQDMRAQNSGSMPAADWNKRAPQGVEVGGQSAGHQTLLFRGCGVYAQNLCSHLKSVLKCQTLERVEENAGFKPSSSGPVACSLCR